MDEDWEPHCVWIDLWSKWCARFKQPFEGNYHWLNDVLFKVLVGKDSVWLHLYDGRNMACFYTVSLGPLDWLAGSYDWRANEVVMAIERRGKRPADAPKGSWKGDAESASEYPDLVERLTETTFQDGSARKPDTMTILVSDRTWRAVLNDKETGESLWVTADTLVGLLAAFQLELMGDNPNWRDTRGNTGSTKKR